MPDLMKHNLSYSKESTQEYFIKPLMTKEQLLICFYSSVLGRLPRKKKKALQATLYKKHGLRIKARYVPQVYVMSPEEISQINYSTIKQEIKCN